MVLTAAANVFDTTDGTVWGAISGGDGGDPYHVSSTTISNYENVSEGFDTILSTASHSLSARPKTEALTLLRNAFEGQGNDLDTTILGNLAANTCGVRRERRACCCG